MPYPVRIQPIDFNGPNELRRFEPVTKPVLSSKSRFKRLFEKQFSRNSDKSDALRRDGSDEFEPSSVCLTRMVENYIEEPNEKSIQKCGKNRCTCFNVNGTDSSDEEQDSDVCDLLKSLVPCSSAAERNLLADVAKIVEANKINKRKDGICRKLVADGLVSLGYNAAVCKSQWDKSLSLPAGMYEYVDVVKEGERLIIDVDFRSEFEIARSSKAYKLVLQTLPNVFVGKADRLESIIDIVSEAAKQSLKKRGLHVAPWRKAEYVKAKWLSPPTRINPVLSDLNDQETALTGIKGPCDGKFGLLFEEKKADDIGGLESSNTNSSPSGKSDGGVDIVAPALLVKQWELPEIKPKSSLKGVKIVTGLASMIEDNDNN